MPCPAILAKKTIGPGKMAAAMIISGTDELKRVGSSQMPGRGGRRVGRYRRQPATCRCIQEALAQKMQGFETNLAADRCYFPAASFRERPLCGSSTASRREILQQFWISADVLCRSRERNRATIQHVSVTGNVQREFKMLFDDDDGDLFCQQD